MDFLILLFLDAFPSLPHSVLSPLCLSSLPCQVGEDNVHTALSLVGYESDLRKAMEYVFGSTLVCDTLDNAKKVAFDKQVMTKTVTLGGDIFDPQGTLSGGEHINYIMCSSLQFAWWRQLLRKLKTNLSLNYTSVCHFACTLLFCCLW